MASSNVLLDKQMKNMLNESIEFGKVKYASYLEEANKAYQETHGTTMPLHLQTTLVKNLRATEEFCEGKEYFREETTPGGINAFIHHAFDMVTAILPNTVIEEFCTIQGMDKRIGEVFYMDIIKGTTKGSNNIAGGEYLSSQYGPKTGQDYSDDRVDLEQIGIGNNADTNTFTPVAWTPMKALYNLGLSGPYKALINYTIGGVSYTATMNSANVITGQNISSGSYNPSTRAVTINWNPAAPDYGTPIYISYDYDSATVGAGAVIASQNSSYENSDASGGIGVNNANLVSGLPEVDIQLTSQIVTAKRRALKTKWLLDTAAMLSKEHGKDIEKELLDAVIAGVMNEIAVELASDVYNTASAGPQVSFAIAPAGLTNIPYVIHRQELLGTIISADINIESAVRKVKANFVIGGASFSNVVRGMPVDLFKPADYSDATPVGMHVIGKLNNQYKIIQNFDYPTNAFAVGAKGNTWLLTGMIYAPFIPLMTTKPITDENLNTFRSLLTYYGKKVVNSSFYNTGIITAN